MKIYININQNPYSLTNHEYKIFSNAFKKGNELAILSGLSQLSCAENDCIEFGIIDMGLELYKISLLKKDCYV